MDTYLYAVRHGETEWNSVERQQGHLDSPLTATGVRQAELLAEGLAKKNIETIFSSDLGRAIQTAEIIAKRLSLDIHPDSRLRERSLGILQGLTRKEFEARYPEAFAKFLTNDPEYVLPGGESLKQVFNRCISCAEELAEANAGKNILLISHGGVLKSFFHKAIQMPLTEPRRFSLFNASINSFFLSNGQWRLETWGELSHLDDLQVLDDR
jgi:2,3-bisphosphoglycerate-dependent phosphoglycerate mutase